MGLISADEFNALFTRLEAVRKNHAALGNLTSAQKTALSTAYNTPASAGVKAEVNDVQELKDDLTNLTNSPYIAATFSSNITIPTVGELLKTTLLDSMAAQVTAVEGICANCAFFTSSAQKGNFSSNFTSRSQKGHFSSDHSSNFGSNFSSDHSSNHSSDHSSNFGSNHSSDHSSNFGSNHSSDHSSNFGSNHSSDHSSNHSSDHSSNFGSDHRSNFGTNFSNQNSKSNFSNFSTNFGANFSSAANQGNFSTASRGGSK